MKDQSIKFVVIQEGYTVFGAGNTRAEAIADSTEWLEMSAAQVKATLVPRWEANDGDLCIITAADNADEFNSYLEDHEGGGFVQREGAWYAECVLQPVGLRAYLCNILL